jgi:hypothetical protein
VPAPFDEEVLKEIFRWQLQRRQAIDAATAMPITVIVVLIGALTFLAREWAKLETSVGNVLLLSGAATSAIFVLLAIWNVARTLWEYNTADLPQPKALYEHIKGLRQFYTSVGTADVEKATEARFRAESVEDYCQAGQVNFETNARRAWYLFQARRAIIVATALLGIAGLGLAISPVARDIDSTGSQPAGEVDNARGSTGTSPSTNQ